MQFSAANTELHFWLKCGPVKAGVPRICSSIIFIYLTLSVLQVRALNDTRNQKINKFRCYYFLSLSLSLFPSLSHSHTDIHTHLCVHQNFLNSCFAEEKSYFCCLFLFLFFLDNEYNIYSFDFELFKLHNF